MSEIKALMAFANCDWGAYAVRVCPKPPGGNPETPVPLVQSGSVFAEVVRSFGDHTTFDIKLAVGASP